MCDRVLGDVCLEILTLLALHHMFAIISLNFGATRDLLLRKHRAFHLNALVFEGICLTLIGIIDVLEETLIVLVACFFLDPLWSHSDYELSTMLRR